MMERYGTMYRVSTPDQGCPFRFASGAVSQCTAIWGRRYESCLCGDYNMYIMILSTDVPKHGSKAWKERSRFFEDMHDQEALCCDAPPAFYQYSNESQSSH